MSALVPVSWSVMGEPPWTAPSVPRGELPDEVACLIVGAGITGLAAALAFAERGGRPVVVDRTFGRGATSRSGGIVLGDTLVGPHKDFDGCEFALRAWVERHAPGCGLQWTGCLEVVRDDAGAEAIGWQDSGRLGVARVVEGGLIDPAAIVGALAEAVAGHGVPIVSDVAVHDLAPGTAGLLVRTSRGTIRAERVLMCTDATAHAARFDPWPERAVTVVLETDVLGGEAADALRWSGARPFYTNDLPLLWGRPLGGNRMLFGRELVANTRGTSITKADIDRASSRLISRVRALCPALTRVGVRRVWAGPVAKDRSGIPSVKADPEFPRVWWAGGYGGHGLAQAFRLGTLAATVLIDERDGAAPG